MPSTPTPGYARRLGLFSATMMVVGGIIGAGIFLNPANVAQRVVAPELILGVWVLGGAIALLGAFCYAELGARIPRAGGSYVYLRQGFGRLPGFLYSWTLLLVIATGAIAAVAVTFSTYTVSLLNLPTKLIVPLAVGAIVFLTLVNYMGVVPGAITQNLFTVLKLLPLAALAAAGLILTRGVTPPPAAPLGAAPPLLVAMASGLVPVLFAYGGWQQLNFVAEEIVEPKRVIPRALFWGVAIVVTTYLLVNVAYLRTLSPEGLAASRAPAADTMQALLGKNGQRLVAAGIAVSTFGFLDLVILVSPRVYRALAADGLFFRRLAVLHPQHRTPTAALLLQAAWAIGLTLSNTYGELLDWVVFGDWIFFGATAATLFVFRHRDRRAPGREDGYRLPLYPLIPILFVAAAMYTVVGSIVSNPGNALRGTTLILVGVPVYWYWSWRARAGGEGEEPGAPPSAPASR